MTVTADPYALADITAFKLARRLSLTDTTQNDLIQQCLNQATSIIETAADRLLAARDFYEWIWDVARNIQCAQYPLNRVKSIRYGNTSALQVVCAVAGAVEGTVEVQETQMVLRSIGSDGTQTETTLLFSTYKSAQALATQIATVSGWSATLVTNCLSQQIKPIAGSDATGYGATLNAALTDVGVDYQVRTQDGTIALNYIQAIPNWIPLQIIYNAGYTTIPAALQKLCVDVALGIYDRLARLAGLRGRTLGDYSESFAELLPQVTADLKGLTPEQYGILSPWMNIPMGKTQ